MRVTQTTMLSDFQCPMCHIEFEDSSDSIWSDDDLLFICEGCSTPLVVKRTLYPRYSVGEVE